MLVTDNGQMLVSLYHGTSKIFLGPIQESGLGVKDPNIMFKSHELLTEMFSLEGWNWSSDPELSAMELTIRYTVGQRVSGGGFNFRHGNTYLTPSELTAVCYALNNPLGSELLSMTISLFDRLKVRDEGKAREVASKHPIISELLSLEHQPLLVEALRVPIRSLRSEKGDAPEVVIDQINNLTDGIDPELFPIVCQQCNFELTHYLPADNLRYYEIEWHDSGNISPFPKYSLRPIE